MTRFPFPQRSTAPVTASPLRRLLLALPLIVLAACNINQPNNPTPTIEILISPTATATRTPTLEPSATASPQVDMQTPIVLVTPPPNNVPNIPTAPVTAQALETPTPWSYTIKTGDTLAGILGIQPWGYNGFDPAIQHAVVQLNNMFSPDILPGAGATLLIPQRTWTPAPQGADMTQTAVGGMGGQDAGGFFVAPGTTFGCYTVQEGDTMIDIAANYSASFELLHSLNQNLDWGQCNFTQSGGGPNCAPFLQINQCVMVPQPTAVPSYTPTASGSETPTATPTRPASRLLYPPEGATIPGGTFNLQWLTAGILAEDQTYLIEVQDVTAGTEAWRQVTRDTAMPLPGTLIPSDGKTHQFQWRVTVVRKDAAGTYAMNDGQGDWRTFNWQSR